MLSGTIYESGTLRPGVIVNTGWIWIYGHRIVISWATGVCIQRIYSSTRTFHSLYKLNASSDIMAVSLQVSHLKWYRHLSDTQEKSHQPLFGTAVLYMWLDDWIYYEHKLQLFNMTTQCRQRIQMLIIRNSIAYGHSSSFAY